MQRGAIVPHAPVLVEGIAGRREPEVEPFRRAVAHVGASMQAEDTVVLLSAHGTTGCVYRRPTGDLSGSGIPGFEIEGHGNLAVAEQISSATGLPIVDEPADHGVVVPHLLGAGGTSAVVGVALASQDQALAVAEVLADIEVIVIASAHLGAGLDPRAPLTLLPEGVDLEAAVVAAAASDCAAFRDSASDLRDKCGSCSADVLLAFGTLFAGRALDVHRYGHPFGVGYIVGTVV